MLKLSKIGISLVIFATLFCINSAVDDTLKSLAYGKDLVNAVNHVIQTSDVFPEDDHRFLIRTAYVETKFAAYTAATGGVWKLSSQAFTTTQSPTSHPELEAFHLHIEEKFNIHWMSVTRAQLDIPLYSGLAFNLFLQTIPGPIPTTIESQAEYWKSGYNGDETTSPATFVNAVNSLEAALTCAGKMDLVVVLDGSGSISPYFEETKALIINLLDAFALGDLRIGFIRYSNLSVVFPLENDLTQNEMVSLIQELTDDEGSDEPHIGIHAAVQMLLSSNSRQGAPRVLATFSDGGGNSSFITDAIENAKENNIIPYAIAIGNYSSPVQQANLLIEAGDESKHLFQLSEVTENELVEIIFQLNDQLCSVSQTRNVQVGDELKAGETRYYNFDVTDAGLTLISHVKAGSLKGYWSATFPNPSVALNDGTFTQTLTTPFVISGAPAGEIKKIYVAVTGSSASNKYTLLAIATNY